jgi:hypothetical protein
MAVILSPSLVILSAAKDLSSPAQDKLREGSAFPSSWQHSECFALAESGFLATLGMTESGLWIAY